jgi:hypothetical protein
MADLITSVASQTGIDGETVKKSLGSLLTVLKNHLDPETYKRLISAIPGAGEILSSYEPGSGGGDGGQGLLSKILALLGRLFGGQAGQGPALGPLPLRPERRADPGVRLPGVRAPEKRTFLPTSTNRSRPSCRPTR